MTWRSSSPSKDWRRQVHRSGKFITAKRWAEALWPLDREVPDELWNTVNYSQQKAISEAWLNSLKTRTK